MRIFQAFLGLCAVLFFGACATTQSNVKNDPHYAYSEFIDNEDAIVKTISEKEVREFYAKYEGKNDTSEQYFQPSNKGEPCKILSSTKQENSKSEKLLWDGECKNGFATGFGRVMEVTNTAFIGDSLIEQIANYENGKPKGKVYQQFKSGSVQYWLNSILKGDDLYGYGISNNAFELVVKATSHNQYNIIFSPITDFMTYKETHNGFTRTIIDYSQSVFNTTNAKYIIEHEENGRRMGFLSIVMKDNTRKDFLITNGRKTRIKLPQNYLSNFKDIFSTANSALELVKKEGLKQESSPKTRYLNKICKANVRVSFLDNATYKQICEDEIKNRAARLQMQESGKKFQKLRQDIIQLKKNRGAY